MQKELYFLVFGWVVIIVLLIKYVSISRLREACLIFMFKQMMTWILGVIVAELGLIEYPVREFPYAYKASFSFEFFVYPSLCVLFNLHYPRLRGRMRQFLHYVYYCSGITIVEVLVEKYTDIIEYKYWTWYITWITLFATLFISRKFYEWYFRLNKVS